jgi:hypothetical protein
VARISERVPWAFLEFGGKLPEFVGAAGDENQVVAFAREDAGEFQSDAERGAGDESGFAVGMAGSFQKGGGSRRPGAERKCKKAGPKTRLSPRLTEGRPFHLNVGQRRFHSVDRVPLVAAFSLPLTLLMFFTPSVSSHLRKASAPCFA